MERPTVLGRTFADLDALAKKAVSQAVRELHAKGIPTYHMEGGQIIETLPDGTSRPAQEREAVPKDCEQGLSQRLSR